MTFQQQREYRQQFTPEIDHRAAIWTSYCNCLNSFMGLESETVSAQGNMVSSSAVSWNRFCYNLQVLDGMIERDKTEKFKSEKPNRAVDVQVTQDRDGVVNTSQLFEYWARIDGLMRDMNFFTTSKLPSGHL